MSAMNDVNNANDNMGLLPSIRQEQTSVKQAPVTKTETMKLGKVESYCN